MFEQPLDLVASYFGETVALYFAGLECYALWLIPPSILGLGVFYLQVQAGRVDHPACCLYGLFISAWSPMLLVKWRRRASELSYRWGVLDYEVEETVRPQFRGSRTQDPFSGEWTAKKNKWLQFCTYLFSVVVVVAAVVIMLGVMGSMYRGRDYATSERDKEQATETDDSVGNHHIPSPGTAATHDRWWWFYMLFYPTLYGLLVPVFYVLFKVIAVWLTGLENHVTNSQYVGHPRPPNHPSPPRRRRHRTTQTIWPVPSPRPATRPLPYPTAPNHRSLTLPLHQPTFCAIYNGYPA